MEFSRQEYWSGLLFPSLGETTDRDLSNIYEGLIWASCVAQSVKPLPVMWETWVQFLGREVPLKKEMATYSSILAWRIPWTEEAGRLQFVGSRELDMT